MQAIQPLWDQWPVPVSGAASGFSPPSWARNNTGVSFAEVLQAAMDRDPLMNSPVSGLFRSAVDAVRQTDAARVQTEYQLATGQLDNPSVAMIAATKAQLSVSLLVQLRNRALEAYQEISRMNL